MFLKKTLLLGSALATLGFSIAAQADDGLTTFNNTDFTSAVRLLSGKFTGACTGALPAPLPSQYTKPHDHTTVGWLLVGLLCKNSAGNICTAEIHMTQQCSGPAVATVNFNLNTKSIENINNVANSGFVVSGQGSTVYLNKA